MTYTKTYPGGFLDDNTTPITAASLNNIEDGIIVIEGQSVGGWVTKTNADDTTSVASFDKVFVDTSTASGGAFSLKLPTSPVDGDTVKFVDAKGQFATNNFTISVPAGVSLMGTIDDTLVLVSNYDFVDMTYFAADDNWIITSKP